MTVDPADVRLEKETAGDSSIVPGGRRPPPAIAITLIVLLAALVAAYLYLRRPTQTAPIAARAPAAARPIESGEQIALPPLDQTDPLVRQLVGRLSSHPAVAAWLTTDGLILNFVVVTSRIATGETPVAELKALGPIPRFRTRTSEDVAYVDPSSYRRYDRYADAVASLDARGAARLYETLKPRIEDGYRRLGPSDMSFNSVLARALNEVFEVPNLAGEVALEPHGTVWAFADPRLQGMSAAQKQLLRMGPQNVRTIQAKLHEIGSYLGLGNSTPR